MNGLRRYMLIAMLLIMSLPLVANAQDNIVNTTTSAGEKLLYDAYYNWHFIWLNAAELSFEASDTIVAGQKRLKLTSIGTSISAYDYFYQVRDTFISVVDSHTLIPYSFYQNNLEGKNVIFNSWTYSADSIVGVKRIGSKKSADTHPISTAWSGKSFDVLTMVYRARNIDFSHCKEGDKVPISLLINGKESNVHIKYLGREEVKLRSGQRYKCIKFCPLLASGTMFNSGEDMIVWLSDDKRRIPVAVEAKVMIGSVKAQLKM